MNTPTNSTIIENFFLELERKIAAYLPRLLPKDSHSSMHDSFEQRNYKHTEKKNPMPHKPKNFSLARYEYLIERKLIELNWSYEDAGISTEATTERFKNAFRKLALSQLQFLQNLNPSEDDDLALFFKNLNYFLKQAQCSYEEIGMDSKKLVGLKNRLGKKVFSSLTQQKRERYQDVLRRLRENDPSHRYYFDDLSLVLKINPFLYELLGTSRLEIKEFEKKYYLPEIKNILKALRFGKIEKTSTALRDLTCKTKFIKKHLNNACSSFEDLGTSAEEFEKLLKDRYLAIAEHILNRLCRGGNTAYVLQNYWDMMHFFLVHKLSWEEIGITKEGFGLLMKKNELNLAQKVLRQFINSAPNDKTNLRTQLELTLKNLRLTYEDLQTSKEALDAIGLPSEKFLKAVA